MKVVSRVKVYEAPAKGQSAYETTYYTHNTGLEKIRMRLLDISDDVPGPRSVAFSSDNGKTWPEQAPVAQPTQVKGGTLREWPCEYFVDPVNDLQVILSIEGVFAHDNAEDGFSAYYLKYRVSKDGGRTAIVSERVIQHGYTPENPLPGMWIGHNAFTNSAPPGMLRLPNGKLLAVISKTVLGPNGKLYNPGGGWGWIEIQVLHGFWQPDNRIDWHAGPIIATTPELSSRGICEAALALMPDGWIMIIMRCSNGGEKDPQGKLPAHKWISISDDSGATWTFPEPWTFDDGNAFHSPASLSQLFRHSNGKLYWLGNIEREKPVANGTRDTLYIGEVDEKSLRLIKDSLFIIAQRGPNDPPTMVSNFVAHEDRATKEIVLHLPWYVEQEKNMWGADTWIYRIEV